MQDKLILSLPLQRYGFAFRLYRGYVLSVLLLFILFRLQRLWVGVFELSDVGFFALAFIVLWMRRSWLSFSLSSICFGGVLSALYLGSPLVSLWYMVVGGGLLTAAIELSCEWARLRWSARMQRQKRLSLWPIEGSEGEGVPPLFSWQTSLNEGVLYQKVYAGDHYRGGSQRIPIARAPLDTSYAKRVLRERTILLGSLVIAPLFVALHWAAASNFQVAPNPTDVALHDIDLDGDIDIVTSNLGETTASILLNDGSGRFAWHIGVTGAAASTRVGMAPNRELVLQSASSFWGETTYDTLDLSSLHRLFDSMGLSFHAQRTTEGLNGYGTQSWQVFSDLNQDGREDAAVITSEGVQIFFGATAKEAAEKKTLPHPVRSDYRVNNIAVADLDRDGFLEVIVSAPEYDQILSYELHGSTIESPRSLIELLQLSSFALGDVNQDGWLDLVTIKDVSQRIEVYLNRGGSFVSHSSIGENPQNIRATSPRVALGDLDGDGDLDLATTDFVHDQVLVFFNNGSGVFSQR